MGNFDLKLALDQGELRDEELRFSRRCLEIAGAEFVEIVDVPVNCVIYQSGHPASAAIDWT